MSKRLSIFWRLIVMLTFLVSAPSLASDDARARGQFLAEIESWLPTSPVVVVFEAEGGGSGRTVCGLDPLSGAWFMTTQEAGLGRTSDARIFRIPGDGQDPIWTDDPGSPWSLGWLIPQAFILAIAEDPAMVKHAERDASTWLVTCTTPSSAQLGDAIIRVESDSGRVLSFERLNENDRRRLDFDWNQDGIGLARSSSGMITQNRKSVQWDASVTDFTPESVFRLVEQNRVIVSTRVQALASGYRESPEGDWISPEIDRRDVSTFSDPWTHRFRVPFILGGIVILVIAATQIIRRRSAI